MLCGPLMRSLAAVEAPPRVDLASLSPGQLVEELGARVSARVKDQLMGGEPWAADPLNMGLPGYRDRYYEVRERECV